MDFEDGTEVLLSKLLPKSSRTARWIYEYDFGDGCRHDVLFEGFPPNDPKTKHPICLEGNEPATGRLRRTSGLRQLSRCHH